MKKKYTIFGNCQTTALNMYLNENKYFRDNYEFQPIKLVHLIEKSEVDIVKNTINKCDLVIYQHISDNYRLPDLATSKLLESTDATLISFPSLYFNGYFPHLDVFNGTSSVMLALHDYNILCAYLFDIKKEDLIDLINNENFYSYEESQYYLNQSICEVKKREEEYALDIRLHDFIKDNYQDKRLFHQFNHPSRVLFEYIRTKLFNMLSIPDQNDDCKIDYLSGIIAPIYPSLYKNLNLKFDDYQNFKKNNKILHFKYVIDEFYNFYDTIDDNILFEWLQKRKKFILLRFSNLFPNHEISKNIKE